MDEDWDRRRKRILEEFSKMIRFDPSKEDHPGGYKLWVSDWHQEEVLLLLEAKEVLTEEQWRIFVRTLFRGEESMSMKDKDPNAIQIGGQHYREANSSFQHWDLVAYYEMNYFIGNMTKYVCRWRKKNGLKDLEKAMHYLEKLIVLHKDGRLLIERPPTHLNMIVVREFCKTQQLSFLETEIVLQSVCCFYPSDLLYIHSKLEELISEAQRSDGSNS